ncbi:AgmX/PglI C-terminal domain-containing protein [Lentisalinibacter sediminis]|uniref:AgmX/PglI C-terminal domain-containing protein n=1 Tax=Lentisalinibacter sediminis TaxID=2992237 RepID=UPI00386C0BC6
MDIPFYREYELPWTVSTDQEQRFRRILAIVCGVLLVLGLIWPWLPVPERDPFETEEIPERFAKLLLEERTPPPPPPPKVEEKPEEPEPVVAEEAVPEEVVPEPAPEPEPVDRVEQAREKASVAGLLPFADELADLRDNQAVASVKADKDLTGSVGSGPSNERSLITSNVAGGSGGINTASLSRNTGGSGLAARDTTKVESPVAGVGGGGGEARRSGDSGKASRSREEIELVFDRNKGAIYALYNRALRRDPTLQGKLVLRLTIAPSGTVTACDIVSSDLGDDELERKLVQRVKLFRFDAKDVEAVTTTKPIDFFPA